MSYTFLFYPTVLPGAPVSLHGCPKSRAMRTALSIRSSPSALSAAILPFWPKAPRPIRRVPALTPNIDLNKISLFHQCNRSADRCLRRYMADRRAAACTEKRPSVISATEDPSPIPAIAEVGFNISRIPVRPSGLHSGSQRHPRQQSSCLP